jgi:hypothetical protein
MDMELLLCLRSIKGVVLCSGVEVKRTLVSPPEEPIVPTVEFVRRAVECHLRSCGRGKKPVTRSMFVLPGVKTPRNTPRNRVTMENIKVSQEMLMGLSQTKEVITIVVVNGQQVEGGRRDSVHSNLFN